MQMHALLFKIKLYKSSVKETWTNISIAVVGGVLGLLIYYKLILSQKLAWLPSIKYDLGLH